MTKVLFITNIISPYRIAFFNHVNVDENIVVKVYYLAEQEKFYQWKTYFNEIRYPFEILKGFHIYLKHRTIHLTYGLFKKLESEKPDVIVIGTDLLSSPVSWFALFYAKLKKIRLIRYESQNWLTVGERLKIRLYQIYYAFVDHFFVYTPLTKDYLTSLNIPTDKITIGYNVGDTDFFYRKTNAFIASNDYQNLRSQYPEVMFLFSGRLVSSKNIMMLLRLFEEIGYPDIGLFVLGDGELQDEVSRLSQKVKTPRIYYEGFKQKEDCISYFSLADIFILPTLLDRASIVMSEALISGLFTIASTYDGSSYYLIQEGNNGLVVNPNDREALKNAILTAYQMKKTGQLAKKSIQDTMEGYTIDKYAQRFIDMIKKRNERQERRLP